MNFKSFPTQTILGFLDPRKAVPIGAVPIIFFSHRIQTQGDGKGRSCSTYRTPRQGREQLLGRGAAHSLAPLAATAVCSAQTLPRGRSSGGAAAISVPVPRGCCPSRGVPAGGRLLLCSVGRCWGAWGWLGGAAQHAGEQPSLWRIGAGPGLAELGQHP